MKKKKKGFTLIELLAVIVILAVIALIASPIVMHSINAAKDGADKDSAYHHISAVENALTGALLEDSSLDLTGDVIVTTCKRDNGETYQCLDFYGEFGYITGIELPMKGTKPVDGSSFRVENGVVISGNLNVNGKDFTYSGGNNGNGNIEDASSSEQEEPLNLKFELQSLAVSGRSDTCNALGIENGYCPGDLIKIGTEEFYITSNDGNVVKALAKYNLKVGEMKLGDKITKISPLSVGYNLQSSYALGVYPEIAINSYYGMVPFASSNYWNKYNKSIKYYIPDYTKTSFKYNNLEYFHTEDIYKKMASISEYDRLNKNYTELRYPYVYDSNSTIYSYLQTYAEKIKKMGVELNTVRLLSYDEFDTLSREKPLWRVSTSYWLGSSDYLSSEEVGYNLWTVVKNNSKNAGASTRKFDLSDETAYSGFGVRPLIEFNISDLVGLE